MRLICRGVGRKYGGVGRMRHERVVSNMGLMFNAMPIIKPQNSWVRRFTWQI